MPATFSRSLAFDRIGARPRTPEPARIRENVVTTAALAGREDWAKPLDSIDVSDPAIYQQDTWQPLFARLRREAAVHYCAESRYGPYWSVTRYNDIMTVELDHATYSSQLGGIQVEDQPADMKRGSFIRMDPPRHTAQRKTRRSGRRPHQSGKLRADDQGTHAGSARRFAPQ